MRTAADVWTSFSDTADSLARERSTITTIVLYLQTCLFRGAMPCILSVHSDGIYRCNDKTDLEELVSNFTVTLNGLVEVSKEAGGPGYLAIIKRFPDGMEKLTYS